MSITARDRKLLWGRSGNRCAFPGCRRPLDMIVAADAAATIIGEECHIVAGEPAGPRGDGAVVRADRDRYENLVLMCHDHHKVIDDDPGSWPIERLHQIKNEHEAWIRAVAEPRDGDQEGVDLQYAVIIDEWARQAQIERWSDWTSHLLASRPSAFRDDLDSLEKVCDWLFRRGWPRKRRDLERSIDNFRLVGNQLGLVLRRTMKNWGEDQVMIETFYKNGWNDNYDRDIETFEWIVLLIHDLVFELTRAGNWVLEEVRSDLDPLYFADNGVLVVVREQDVMNFVTWRPGYTVDELQNGRPFVDVKSFSIDRERRDVHFGTGQNDDGYRRVSPMRLGSDG